MPTTCHLSISGFLVAMMSNDLFGEMMHSHQRDKKKWREGGPTRLRRPSEILDFGGIRAFSRSAGGLARARFDRARASTSSAPGHPREPPDRRSSEPARREKGPAD